MSFTPIDGYAIVASLSVGSNSLETNSAPELTIADAGTESTSAQFLWDANTEDGFDSGWVHFQLDVNAAGGADSIQFSVGNSSPVVFTFDGDSYDTIQGFLIRAGVVGADRTFSFRNLIADFYEENATTPTVTSYADDFSATTVGSSEEDNEAISVIAPDGYAFRRASLFGDVRLISADEPTLNDVFGELFVFEA